MDEILIAYATKHGSTHEVAETVAARLTEAGVVTHTAPAARVASLDAFDAVVLGAPLYMGRLHGDARTFLRRFRARARRQAVRGLRARADKGRGAAVGRRANAARPRARGREPGGGRSLRRGDRPRNASLPVRPPAGRRSARLGRDRGVGARPPRRARAADPGLTSLERGIVAGATRGTSFQGWRGRRFRLQREAGERSE